MIQMLMTQMQEAEGANKRSFVSTKGTMCWVIQNQTATTKGQIQINNLGFVYPCALITVCFVDKSGLETSWLTESLSDRVVCDPSDER